MIQDFPNGKLWMSDEPLEAIAREASWAQDPLNSVLAILSIVLLIIFIRDFFILWTPIMRCLVRAKANIEMEHSFQLARTRNRAALLLVLPMLLISERFGLISESMWITLAVVAGYLVLKRLMSELVLPRRLPAEMRVAVRRALYTYFIVLAAIMLVTVGLWTQFRWDGDIMKIVFGAEALAILALSTLREGEILSSTFPPFVSFLYLCALEIVPAAGLIAAGLVVD